MTMDKLKYVKDQLAGLRYWYHDFANALPDLNPSAGMVANWNRIGGFSTRISDTTSQKAMAKIEEDDVYKRKIAWIDAVYDAFFEMIDRHGKSPKQYERDVRMSEVLRYYVFDQKSLTEITIMLTEGKVYTRQYVGQVFDDAAFRVMEHAKKRRLLPIK